MQDTQAFAPIYRPSTGTGTGGLVSSTTVAATTSGVASTQFAGAYDGNVLQQIQIANTTNGWAFVNFGQVGVLAAATVAASYPVAPGGVVVVTVPGEVNGAHVILASGATTGSVIFSRGGGL